MSLFVISCFAQSGFYIRGTYVPYNKISSRCSLVSTKRTGDANAFNRVKKENNGLSLSSDRCLIERANVDNDTSVYVSGMYTSPKGDTILIAPSIVVKTIEKRDCADILEMFGDLISLEKEDGLRLKFRCHVSSPEDVMYMANVIHGLPNVKWSKPEVYSRIDFQNTYYQNQYYLKNTGQNYGTPGIDINAEPAWAITNGSSSIVVAVIDSGVDFDHEDLQGRLLSGYTIGENNSLGAPINANQYNDWQAHGTACAGIIAANNNNIGVRGIASGVKILPVNVFTEALSDYFQSYSVSDSQLAEAISWAAGRADVLSCSWMYLTESDDINDEIDNARTLGRNGKGCVVVFSSGNYPQYYQGIAYPASHSGVISVGAIDKEGVVCAYSQTGTGLDLVAIGGYSDIYTTDRMGNIGFNSTGNYATNFGGTSAACPQVAGVAALVLSLMPTATEQFVRDVLTTTARDLGPVGQDTIYGYGLVDAFEAVNIVRNDRAIVGKALTQTGETYYVSNLSSHLNVVWSATGNVTVVQNSPSTNQCTLIVNSNSSTNATLYADIYFGSIYITRLYMPISTQYTGTYYQSACTYYGVNHPAISSKSLIPNYPNYVHMGCTVYANSPAFSGATITHSGITPEEFYHSPASSQQVRFALPYGSTGMPFHIYVNGDATSNDYHFLFFPVSGNGNLTSSLQVQASGTGYELTLIRQESEQWTGERGDMEWDVEVYDTLRGALMHRAHVKGDSYKLDTSAWRAGTYVVRAVTGDDEEPLVEKIQVK